MRGSNEQDSVIVGPAPGAGWVKVARGIHRRPDDSKIAELAAWQEVLRPMTAFTHLTAAEVRGLWLPPLPDGLPVWAAMLTGRNASTRKGLVISRHRAIPPSELISGVRVASVGESLLACAVDLGLLDLVVLVDSALHLRLITREELARVAAQHRRGAPNLRKAIRWSDGRSESPFETLLRVLHEACGIRVEPQHELVDEHGVVIARGDLWLVGTDAFHEYDGADHLTRPAQRRDLKRARRIGHARFVRRGYTREDVLFQAFTILRDADLTLGRPHDPGRIKPWHDMLRESLFTPAGTARFCDRLGIEWKTAGLGA